MTLARFVRRDGCRFGDLLRARTGDELRELRLRRVDGSLLLGDLAVDGLGLQRHEELAGRDVGAFIDQNADDAAADERPDLHGPRFE